MGLIRILFVCLLLACANGLPARGQETKPTAEDSESEDETTIQIWVGTYDDYEGEGIAYGCGSYLLPVDTGITRSGDTIEDLRLALEALLSPDLNHPEANTEDALKDLNLAVEEITIVEGEAVVALAGTLLGPGHCGDAIIEGQILQTVFQFEAIERVKVSDGETNLWTMIDLTGWYSEAYRDNYVYERPDAEPEPIHFWVGTYEDYEADGIAYGCDSYLLPVDSGATRTGNPHTDLSVALEALFDADLDHPEAETEDWLKGLGLSVELNRARPGRSRDYVGWYVVRHRQLRRCDYGRPVFANHLPIQIHRARQDRRWRNQLVENHRSERYAQRRRTTELRLRAARELTLVQRV